MKNIREIAKGRTFWAALFLLLATNTSFLWEQIPGVEDFLIFMILSLVYLIALVVLGLKLGTMALERFRNKMALIRWGVIASILMFIFIFPTGIYHPLMLGGEPVLTAQREGSANCRVTLYLLDDQSFVERSVCFGVDRKKGSYRVNGDTIHLDFDALQAPTVFGLLSTDVDGDPNSLTYVRYEGDTTEVPMAVIQWDSRWWSESAPTSELQVEDRTNPENRQVEESYLGYWQRKVDPVKQWASRLDSLSQDQGQEEMVMDESARFVTLYPFPDRCDKWLVEQTSEKESILTLYYIQNDQLRLAVERIADTSEVPFSYWRQSAPNFGDRPLDHKEFEWLESQYYFQDDSLIYLYVNQDCGAPFADEYMRSEEARLLKQYQSLRKLKK